MILSIERRIRHAQIGLICTVIAMAGLVVCFVSARVVAGYSLPRFLLFFCLVSDACTACFFLWLLKRLKKQQSQK
jgi:hypothetical protein